MTPTDAPPDRRERNRRRVREALRTAALELFSEKGFAETTVTDITDEVVILDGNHPLAGMSLRFDLEVDDLREATNEEVAAEIERQKPD